MKNIALLPLPNGRTHFFGEVWPLPENLTCARGAFGRDAFELLAERIGVPVSQGEKANLRAV
ncbi:MAG: hypothetical protein FWH26_10255, partial [Oscillospiraceae bacterium]|nr:hypothetical protein [Oscillospiraceae bacterium]